MRMLGPLYYNIAIVKKTIDLTAQPEFSEKWEYHPNYADFRENCREFEVTWREATKISKILRDLKVSSYPSPEYEAMSKMLSYLGLVESWGVAFADAILILLIANERGVHTKGTSTKHVTKVRELDKIDLAYKLEFLEDEGFDIFRKLINKDTRNHIAHLRFSIQENGEIRKRDGSPIHIDDDIKNFWYGVDVLRLLFGDVGFLPWLTGESPFSVKERVAGVESKK